mmetsp:Transcript_519/g.566  ORF Transcript_519/g.566 Transcript_519/m.566 type:complete len:124 (-) Transcript_519:576-947(-)
MLQSEENLLRKSRNRGSREMSKGHSQMSNTEGKMNKVLPISEGSILEGEMDLQEEEEGKHNRNLPKMISITSMKKDKRLEDSVLKVAQLMGKSKIIADQLIRLGYKEDQVEVLLNQLNVQSVV